MVRHGSFSTLGLAMNLVTVFMVMLPVFLKLPSGTSIDGFVQLPSLWAHVIVGALTLD
jgi:hypothetical protein